MRSHGRACASPARKNRKRSGVKQTELQHVLAEFAAERLALLEHHEAAARVVSHYDFNNAYQYVINREEVQLTWLQTALAEFGTALPPASPAIAVPDIAKHKTVDATTF